jgi:IS5 family transposase
VYDPYFQYSTGEAFSQHAFPHERSGLTHWCNRPGGRLEKRLAEGLRVTHATGALKGRDLSRGSPSTPSHQKFFSARMSMALK